MTNLDKPPRYKSFLLTVWEERSGETILWRYGLEDPKTGQRRAFASPEALVTALQQITAPTESAGEIEGGFGLPTDWSAGRGSTSSEATCES
jgi:hypothetical protein